MDYKDKVAVVTAAASGIGREIVLELGRRGAHVVATDYDGEGAERVAGEISAAGGSAMALRCDVGSDADMAALGKAVLDRFGHVDILINHAGAAAGGPADRTPLDDWRWVFEINVLGIARALNVFLPSMTERGSGLIVNTASGLGLFPEVPFVLPYITTKAGVVGLSEALALYCEPLGIRVMTLLPDITKTNFHYSGRITGLNAEKMAKLLPLSQEQLPVTVSDALFEAIEQGRFAASNIPDFDRQLIDKAQSHYRPDFRLYPQIRDNLKQHWPVDI